MNWETVLTTLWNKISKPVTNILIGASFLLFAPDSANWFGWIFLAVGFGGFLDQQSRYLPKIWQKFQKHKKIKEELNNLSDDEEFILKLMVQHNKKIMRQPDFQKAFSVDKNTTKNELPIKIYDVFTSLDDKNLVYYNCPDFGYFNVTASDYVWKIIKTRFKKDFNTVNKREA